MLPMTRELSPQAARLLAAHQQRTHARTDRWFAYLMVFQFAAGLLLALLVSPRAWEGAQSHMHPHVWAAAALGGAISALPVALAILKPGALITRIVIGCGQMLVSALLIHLTGGRIETHFHVFGSLAFLAFYCDWRVLAAATAVVASDHVLRGLLWPESVYGVAATTPWRSLEHASWVLFEDIFLIRWCLQREREMREIAARTADLQAAHSYVEDKVRSRTAELCQQRSLLEEEVLQRSAAENKLRQLAYHDALTGLANRSLLRDRLTQCVSRNQREPSMRFALLYLDFDGFKVVNDSLGHPMGDQLLVCIAQRLRACLRTGEAVTDLAFDCIARVGGDEFVILLESIALESDATAVAARIHEQFARAIRLDGHDIFTTASIGIVVNRHAYANADDMLRDADAAMYAAKAAGKARSVVFDPRMHVEAVERLQLEHDLRQALDHHQFRLAYQPIVNLQTMHVAGFEALLRWNHPTRGEVSPANFIPLAEETGLIVPIGRWVLHQACQQLAAWRLQFPALQALTVSVNVSKRQFSDRSLIDSVLGALRSAQLPGSALQLEITESVIMRDPRSVRELLEQVKSLGVPLHMDDFGTGYSSLSYLHQFPLQVLKIDRSFLNNLNAGLQCAALIHAIVVLAHNLKMQVTIEGIETQDQLAQVLALDCDYGQGFLFARPLAPSDAEAMLARPAGFRAAA